MGELSKTAQRSLGTKGGQQQAQKAKELKITRPRGVKVVDFCPVSNNGSEATVPVAVLGDDFNSVMWVAASAVPAGGVIDNRKNKK